MRIKLLVLLFFLGILSGWTQERNDSTVCFSISEVRVLTKMSEDLRYTKAELEAADSIIYHQTKIISLKDQKIELREQEIKESSRRQIRVGLFSGGLGMVLGILLGIFL